MLGDMTCEHSNLASNKLIRVKLHGKSSGVTSCVTRLVTLILCMLGVYIAPEIIQKTSVNKATDGSGSSTNCEVKKT